MKKGAFQWVVWLSFGLCMALLARFILFKQGTPDYRILLSKAVHLSQARKGWRNANLVPFETISNFYNSRRLRTSYKVDNIGGNILGFIPPAFLLCYLVDNRRRGSKVFLMILSISLGFELIQLLTGLGAFDVDDLILNGFGGLLGIFLFNVTRPIKARSAG